MEEKVLPGQTYKGINVITDILHNLSLKCKENNLSIIGFVSDRDNCMSKYHSRNIEI